VTLITAGCGGGSNNRSPARATALVLMARAPNSLDPAVGDTPEALEADWLVYTPLLTYRHAAGPPGTQLAPGIAQTLPGIAAGGTIYTFTLIKGLRYSNGQPVRASDFTLAVERAIRLWPQASRLITSRIAGAAAFAARHAKTIAGITTNDQTGQITIRLTAPFGAFENVLALPVLAPVPAGTTFKDQRADPPPGVGPYRLADVVPGRSFALVRISGWPSSSVDVPAGHLDIEVRITGDATANARAVLDGAADVFDSADQIPPSLLGRVRRAANRYLARPTAATSLVFLDTSRKPFSSQLAREAVRAGIGQTGMAGLDPDLLSGCFVLPPVVYGHPQGPCPDSAPVHGDLALARALVKRSGMAGTRVAVSAGAGSPVKRWLSSYVSLLDRIGFEASLESGHRSHDSQTGLLTVDPRLPNPVYFYEQLIGPASRSRIDDPYLHTALNALAAVPGSTLIGVSGYWSQLERYVANRAYVAVLGYPTAPELVSSRIDFPAVVFSPLAGVDWSSLALK
jgi:peptide/nickel transport system substrate-binding protein